MSFSDKLIALGGASGFASVMAGVFLLGALAWRAELWSSRTVVGSIARSAPNREKVAAPLFAILLLSSAVGAPIGTAAAATTTEDCSGVDAMIYDMVTVGEYSLADQEEHPCSPAFQRSQAIEEMENATAEQEKLDIYNAALSQKANNEVFSSVSSNYLDDTRSVAWMHAETAMANAYQNGSSATMAKSEARGAIDDYYTRQQLNRLERWEVALNSWYSLHEIAKNQSGINEYYVRIEDANNDDDAYLSSISIVNRTVTLINGTQTTVESVRYRMDNSRDTDIWYVNEYNPVEGTKTPEHGGGLVLDPGETYHRLSALYVEGYDAGTDGVTMVDTTEARNTNTETEVLANDLTAEVSPFVDATYSAFEQGTINASDLISRNNLMFRYGTDALNNTDQNLYDSTAALASMGLANPNISSTGSMTVEYENVTYTGMVLAESAPSGSWETGTTYNTSNIGGVVLLATTGGERIDMTGEFTLTGMKNQDGDQIDQTSATKVVYQTSNTSEILDKMSRILELRAQIESTKPKAGSGATSDGGGGGIFEKLAAFLGISAGAAVVVLGAAAVLVLKIYSP